MHLQEKDLKTSTNEPRAISKAKHKKHDINTTVGYADSSHLSLTLSEEKTIPQSVSSVKVNSVHAQNIDRDTKPKKQKVKTLYTVRAVVDYQGSKSKMSFNTGDEIMVYDDTSHIKYHLGKLIKSERYPLNGKKMFFKPQHVVKIEGSKPRRRASVKPSSSSRTVSNRASGKRISKTRSASVA